MKLAVGYPLMADDEPFAEIVSEFREHIAEVYFAWPGEPSGRSVFGSASADPDSPARQLTADLLDIRDLGMKLDLLLNANCYGAGATSADLAEHVVSLVGELTSGIGLEVVTTTSPLIAAAIKERFPRIEVRASVNMRIGTVAGMRYLADVFDSFYVQRDYNRDPERLRELHDWAEGNGKRLCVLANSGCLRFCSGQTFHDNLVAHEREMAAPVDASEALTCRRYLRDPANWAALLQATWIRPEDLHHYEGYYAVAKLATRMHSNPRRVIGAYATGRFRGNLLDLLEPGYGALLAGHILDATRFPSDWHERTTACGGRCEGCGYCAAVLREVLAPAAWPRVTGRR